MPRMLEVVLAGVGIVLLAPLLLLIAVAIRFSDNGPVFYRGERVGRNGRLFRVYKFRTMVPGAHSYGAGLTTADDFRITSPGRFLRRFKLDELPQLLNVLKGEMSFVGPRPEDPRYISYYTPEQRRVLDVRPGITSPASLRYRNEADLLSGDDWLNAYTQKILPSKLAIDLEYFKRRTVLTDLRVILQTLREILK